MPEDLSPADFQWLTITGAASDAFDQVLVALRGDPWFEYLDGRSAKTLVWRLACQAHIERGPNHVEPFIRKHAREPTRIDVFFTVRHLNVREEFELGGATFLPTSSASVPALDDMAAEPGVRGIMRTAAVGTDVGRIVERARAAAEQVLRVLRNGLRTVAGDAHRRQLRFGLGERYAFADSQRAGWRVADEVGWDFGVDAAMAAQVAALPTARLGVGTRNNVEAHANMAMRWADRSLITPDPLVRILYLFFALEGLVGDRGAGEKATRIAFRRAMLDHATSGGFRDPDITYTLYDEVRSVAVHGGQPPAVTERDADRLDGDVRAALDQLLDFAAAIGESKHSRVLHALDRHPDASELVQWLQDTDQGTVWHDFKP